MDKSQVVLLMLILNGFKFFGGFKRILNHVPVFGLSSKMLSGS